MTNADSEHMKILREAWKSGERPISLPGFRSWAQREQPLWQAQGAEVDISPITERRDKNSMWIDVKSREFRCRIIVWDSGEWEAEIVNEETDEIELSEYRPAVSLEALITKVRTQLQNLGIAS